MDTQPLIGDVTTQLVYAPESCSEEFAIEAARADQEMMVGYPLVLKGIRRVQVEKGFELFVTFSPELSADQEEKA